MNEAEETVYLDNSNFSFVPREIINAMQSYFPVNYGHPALVHKAGRNSLRMIEETRKKVAETLNCTPDEVIFTSGLTESNNMGLQGLAYAKKANGNQIIISEVEPPSVSRVAEMLGNKGFHITRVNVNENGVIDLDQLQEKITNETILISISGVADEIGTLEPLKAVKEIVEDKGNDISIHTDFSNGYTKIPIDIQEYGVDLLTIGGRKIHVPPGIGILFVKEGEKVSKIMEGTLTTNEIRPGVENVPLIGAIRKAVEMNFERKEGRLSTIPKYTEKIRRLQERLYKKIFTQIDDILLNGPKGKTRSPSNLNISFKRVEGEAITLKLSKRGIYVATGSACARRSLKASPVLKAIGRSPEEAHGSIIFELSQYITQSDIDYVVRELSEVITELREISALEE